MTARMRGAGGAALVAAALVLLASPADVRANVTVRSAPLSATVATTGTGFALAVRDRRGLVLATRGPALGFRTATARRRATRVLSSRRAGRVVALTLATDDPDGRRLAVRLSPAGDGVVRLEAAVVNGPTSGVTAVGLGLSAARDERFLGFGERSNAVDQRGREVESYVADGPYTEDDRPIVAQFVPPVGFRARDDATYFPMPWLLSTRGVGVLVDGSDTSRFDLVGADRGSYTVEADAPRLVLRLFAGPRPADVLRRLTAAIGRQPAPNAPWILGPWYQASDRPADGDVVAQVRRLRAAGAPLSVVQTYLHYLPCGDQRRPGVRDRERLRTAALHGLGVATTTYLNPMLCTNYAPVWDEAVRAGVLSKDAQGRPLTYRYSTADDFTVGQFDPTAPGTDAFLGRLLAEPVADGHDGWMEDFGEYTPLDAVDAEGRTGAALHNLYPVQYHRAFFRVAQRQPRPVAGFVRSGWTGVHPYARVVWGGDPTTTFGFDGLESVLRQGLTMGLSGIALWGSDIGGFFAILDEARLTPELLRRWIELGAVSGVMRNQAEGIAIPPKERPQPLDADVLPTWRRYTRLRTALLPYLEGAVATYRATGLPIMRHLALTHPEDAEAARRDDQFMFGDDLLAAPVVREGERERELHLPRGTWVDLWRSADPDALALGRPRLLDGGGPARLPAPLGELPLLARAGTVLPLLDPDVETLAAYDGPGVTTAADRAGRMRLLAFPRGASVARLGARERLASHEGRGAWRLTFRTGRTRTYALQAALGTLRAPFRPCRVTSGGRRVAFTYDASTTVLRTRVGVRPGASVTVTACRSR